MPQRRRSGLPPTSLSFVRLCLAAFPLVAFLLLAGCGTTPRNVRLATYNGGYLVAPANSDGKYFDSQGNPLTNLQRARVLAQNALAADVDVLALNEVFDEDARDELVKLLKASFPFYVAYVGNDSDPSDSGLMLFSRLPFQTMQLDAEHVYECGDVELGYGGVESECSDQRLGFSEFRCAPEYALDSDCFASKGVGLVKVRLPFGESMYVGFSHFLASYPGDSNLPLDVVPCAKKRDRQRALRQFQALVEDAVAEAEGDVLAAHVVLAGDLNITGNPFRTENSPCLDSEWEDAFAPGATVRFTSCADQDRATCAAQRRVLVDAWKFTTSRDDLGRTNGFDFTLDLGDQALRGDGQRLDYVAVRGPVVLDPAVRMMIPQHMTLAYGLSGERGELSDHLPVAANLLFPPEDTVAEHSMPKDARPLVLPAGASQVSTSMTLAVPGQMQWLHFDGPPGTYTFHALSGGTMGLDVYAPHDLTRPIEPRRADQDRGFVYVLNDPPYFLRTFAAWATNPKSQNRSVTTGYVVAALRHDCTSPQRACILTAGATGEAAVAATWPAGNPVNSEDALWFEFYADDPSGPQPPTLHDFAVTPGPGLVTLPEFGFQVVDFPTLAPLPGVAWETTTWTVHHRERRARGIVGNAGQTPTFANHLLKVLRPPADLGFGGTVRVSHRTNLTYMTPLTLSIEQEEDDSAHDELRIFLKADNSDTFYQLVHPATIHQHAAKFQALPQIDELEDGGSPWPAGIFGTLRLTAELPLVLIEDDDEDGVDEAGDFLLALPHPANPHPAAGGFALAPLPSDQPGGNLVWRWTDEPGESDPDDTSYLYTLRFELTHCPPAFTCDG